jgi:hypothetical protein
MAEGIRVEVKIDRPDGCTVAQASAAVDGSTYSVSRSLNPEDPETVTVEFMLDADLEGVPLQDDVEPVFRYGSQTVYRYRRQRGRMCPCECVEAADCPVVDLHTRGSSLFLVFHAPDMERLQTVVRSLRDRFPSLDVQRLLRSREDRADHSLVFVDRGKLTDRQREVLETAHELGYFEHPKESNGGEVADALGISTSTFAEHLSAAQRKLLATILDG